MADESSTDSITATIPNEPQLDTPVSDAAIDDIVAQEADEVLAAEDAATASRANDDVSDEPESRGHPIFWSIIALMVILVMCAVYVLTTPGLSLPFGL